MQDNASNTSRSTKQWLSVNNVSLLDWSACSPDLNPLENVCSILSRKIYDGRKEFANMTDLLAAIKYEWANLDVAMIPFIPDRLLSFSLYRSEMTTKEEDPVMKLYKAQAIVIEKEAEMERLRKRIEELERERLERIRGEPSSSSRDVWAEISKLQKGMEELKEANSKLLETKTTLEDRLIGGNETILIMGGDRNRDQVDEMVLLDRKTSTWKRLNLKLPCKNDFGGSALLNGEIYIFGGYALKKKLYKLDSQQMRWIEMAEMNEERRRISNSSLVFQGCIWVFGGLKENAGELKTVEKYCPERNEWIKMPGMSQTRYLAAAAVCNEKIFVSGGNNGGTFLKSVECFDPTSGVWTPMVDMPDSREGHSMISDGSSLFVMGGCHGIRSINTAWRIRPSEVNAIWEELQPMNEARNYFTAKSLSCSTPDNKKEIYAIGGSNGWQTLDSVEIFDGERWRDGPYFPNECRSMSSVVIPSSLAERLFSA